MCAFVIVVSFRQESCCPLQFERQDLRYYEWKTASLHQEYTQVYWYLASLLYHTHFCGWNYHILSMIYSYTYLGSTSLLVTHREFSKTEFC